MEDKPLMEIRPVVVPTRFLIAGPLLGAVVALFPGVFAFVISNLISAVAGGGDFDGPMVVFGLIGYILGFAAALVLFYLKTFKEPLRTCYKVYTDRLEYDEGFLTRHRRTLVFDQVIDVQLTEGLLQQSKNAGTITLVTQQLVSSGEAQLSNRQIALRDVPNPREAYDLIRSVALDKGRRDRS